MKKLIFIFSLIACQFVSIAQSEKKSTLFSINTGIGNVDRYSLGSGTEYKMPLLIAVEKTGKLGSISNLPNWISYGGYFRHAKQVYNWTSFGSEYTTQTNIYGIGARGSVDIMAMIDDLSDSGSEKKSPLTLYAGAQIGWDFVTNRSTWVYNYNYAYGSGLRTTPFVGARLSAGQKLGIQAELGRTANRTLTVGVSYKF
jgi:hypothetical protein